MDLGCWYISLNRVLSEGINCSIVDVLSLACAKVGVCYIRGSRVPTGVSSYPGVYHCTLTPVWGMLYPGIVSLLVLAPTLVCITKRIWAPAWGMFCPWICRCILAPAWGMLCPWLYHCILAPAWVCYIRGNITV